MFNWENNVTPLNDTNLNQAQRDLKSEILLACYPVGSYYWSSESTDPGTFFGGTWERVKDVFLYALGDTGNVGDTGGTSSHKHLLPFIVDNETNWTKFQWNTGLGYGTIDKTSANTNAINNTPSATAFSGKQLYSQGVSNLPPYIKAYCWKRTA